MKKLLVLVIVLGAVSPLIHSGCVRMTPQELKASIEIADVETKWVSKLYQPWPPRLILVPQFAFRVKNLTAKPLTYVNFNAVFNFKGDRENFGDCFLAGIRGKAVPPGEKSGLIVMKSNFGVDGRDLKTIQTSPAWKQAEVRLFAQSRGTQPVLIGVFDVSRFIDFKEDVAPAEPKK
ncbi:MAG TPA: hypothetical protein VMS75_03625 [Terriglobales bacterium]|nr:hypothetical protein [Terriglobales bacterium]